LNPTGGSPNRLPEHDVTSTPTSLTANRQHLSDSHKHRLSSDDASLLNVIEAWEGVPPQVGDTIAALCQAVRKFDRHEVGGSENIDNFLLKDLIDAWLTTPPELQVLIVQLLKSLRNIHEHAHDNDQSDGPDTGGRSNG